MPRPLHPISQTARDALAARYAEHGLPSLSEWVRSGQADNSTLTPCLEALTAAEAVPYVPRAARPPLELEFVDHD